MQLPARLTMAEGASAMAALRSAPTVPGPLSIDASTLVDFDTAALALLLDARRLAAQRGQAFELRHAPAQLCQLARLYGVADLLQLDGAA